MKKKMRGAGKLRIAMSGTEYYTIPNVKNDDMDVSRQPDKEKATRQWTAVFNNYQQLGFEVYLIAPKEHLPELCFAANGLVGMYNDETGKSEAVLSNFFYYDRSLEKKEYRRFLSERGYREEDIFEIPENIKFEGQGDFITLNDRYIFTSGVRSSPHAVEHIKRLLRLKKPVETLRLVGTRFYHGDTTEFSLRYKEAHMYFADAFDGESVDKLRSFPQKHLEVAQSVAEKSVCNSVYLGGFIFLNIAFPDYCEESFSLSARGVPMSKEGFVTLWSGETVRDPRYEEMLDHDVNYEAVLKFLWDLGYENIPAYTSEFKLSGAGVRCLTLFLD